MKNSAVSSFDQFVDTLWGRENEMEYIRNAIQVPQQGHSSIHYFHGISGVGKSKLCDYTRRYVQTQLQAPYSMVNIDMSSDLAETQIIHNLYCSLVTHVELPFPHYEIASSYLFKITGDPIYKIDLPSNTSRLTHSVFDYATKLGASILELSISTNNDLLTDLSAQLVACTAEWFFSLAGSSLHKHLSEYITNKKHNELEQFCRDLSLRSPNEIRHNLSQYFMEDLKQSLESIQSTEKGQNYRLIITIDAFEKRAHTKSFNSFLQRLFKYTGGTIWFLFGTESFIPQQNTQSISLHSYPISPFDATTLRQYLKQHGVDSVPDQDTIINVSNGLPAAVQIVLDSYWNNGGHLDETLESQSYTDLFNQYFSKHLTEAEQKIFSRLAYFDYWNQEIISYILPESDSLFESFENIINKTALVVKSSSAETGEERYCLVDIVRKSLLAQQESEKNGLLIDNYRIKYSYEKKFQTDIWNN